jgi:hypothetical protein
VVRLDLGHDRDQGLLLAQLGRLGVYGLILGRLPLGVFSIGKYAFQKKILLAQWSHSESASTSALQLMFNRLVNFVLSMSVQTSESFITPEITQPLISGRLWL